MQKIKNLSKKRWVILTIVITAYMPLAMDLTILHVAIPSLSLGLKATGNEVLWIIDIYPLIMAGLLVPMGTLTDRVGPKRMLSIGLTTFGLSSLFASFAPNAHFLIVTRAVMACGAAMCMPCVLVSIRHAFEDWKERALALGVWATTSSAGAAAGPLVGGFLIEHFWWGAVFLINIPIIIIVFPFIIGTVPSIKNPTKGRWPVGQALVLITGLISTVYAIKSTFKVNNSSLLPYLIIGAIGIVLIVIFIITQLRSKYPMLDLKLFKIPAVTAGLIIALVVSGAMSGAELTIAQELQFTLFYSPLEAGLYMLPMMTAAAISGPLAGFLLRIVKLRDVCGFSLLIAGFALGGISYTDLGDSRLVASVFLAVLGFALGIGLTASSIAVISAVPKIQSGSASALESLGYDLGTGFGITLFGVMLAFEYQAEILVPQSIINIVGHDALNSIADTMVAVEGIGGTMGDTLAEAGRVAFLSAHHDVLFIASVMVVAVGLLVFYLLRKKTVMHGR